MRDVESVLDDNGYDYSEFTGCFDIAARKQMPTENILLLKVLENVDSFMEDHANNLSIVAGSIDANAVLVGNKTRTENLQDNIIYERFGVNTVNTHTLELILDGNIPKMFRSRGGLFAEINHEMLRTARTAAGLTQEELAKRAGVTKKNIYEHESMQMKMHLNVAEKLEAILDAELMQPISLLPEPLSYNNPTGFGKKVSEDMEKIGMSTKTVYKTPFNIIAEIDNGRVGRSFIISDAETSAEKARKNAPNIAAFADITGKFGLAVTKDDISLDIPSITEQRLRKMHSSDIKKMLS